MHLGHQTVKMDEAMRPMRIYRRTKPIAMPKMNKPSWDIGDVHSYKPSHNRHRQDTSMEPRTLAKRLPRRDSGFHCTFASCTRTFDRACELRKHERRHEPKENLQYHCSRLQCGKPFMYPKDLTRLMRVHEKQASHASVDESLSTGEMMSNSSVG